MEETPNGTTWTEAIGFAEDASVDFPFDKAATYLGTAYRWVKRIAPVPDTEDAATLTDYSEAAKEAELLAFDWLVSTRGFKKSDTLSGVSSETFGGDAELTALIAGAMGEYATNVDGSDADSGVAYFGRVKRPSAHKTTDWWVPE